MTQIEHPDYYNTGKYEVLAVIEDWNLNFMLGNAVKYIARAGHKDSKYDDLKKAIFYLQEQLRYWKEEENEAEHI